jgi:hypothetical protein
VAPGRSTAAPAEADLDAVRRHCGGRVEAPPFAVDHRLGPRVRVALRDDQVPAAGIDLAALVAGDHACGNAAGAQQHDERARIVLAESAALAEQEAIDRIVVEHRRRQRVDERLGVNHASTARM